jgi:hypothetical protein
MIGFLSAAAAHLGLLVLAASTTKAFADLRAEVKRLKVQN